MASVSSTSSSTSSTSAAEPNSPPRLKSPSSSSPSSTLFTKIQATAVEALQGKGSCIAKGYYNDRFLQHFRPTHPPPVVMSPLINRGYFTRVRALEHVIEAFRASIEDPHGPVPEEANILILGAGLDTLCFRLMDEEQNKDIGKSAEEEEEEEEKREEGQSSSVGNTRGGGGGGRRRRSRKRMRLRFFEVDYATVVHHKAARIKRSNEIMSLLGLASSSSIQREGGEGGGLVSATGGTGSCKDLKELVSKGKECGLVLSSHASDYNLLAADLADTIGLEDALKEAKLDTSLPTLIVTECVLVYMEPEDSTRLIKWSSQKFHEACFVSYDMILPDDSFGRVMRTNLKGRGLELPGFERWRDLNEQMGRMVDEGGWDAVVAGDMNTVYEYLLDPLDHKRATKLEHLDEVEEWRMLMGHYCYVIASQGSYLGGLLWGLKGFEERNRCCDEKDS